MKVFSILAAPRSHRGALKAFRVFAEVRRARSPLLLSRHANNCSSKIEMRLFSMQGVTAATLFAQVTAWTT